MVEMPEPSNLVAALEESTSQLKFLGNSRVNTEARIAKIFGAKSVPNEGKTIRLLRLLPGGHEDQISGELHVVSLLEEKPDYAAISYTWGGENTNNEILLDGSPFGVTSRLLGALKQLRNSPPASFVWADQICIDQSNDEEKSFQVRLMTDIYKNTSHCMIWLGETGHGAPSEYEVREGINLLRSRDVHADVHKDGIRAIDWLGVQPWWRRIWTVQEVALPEARKVHFYIGSQSLTWVDLCFANSVRANHADRDCCRRFFTMGQRNNFVHIQNAIFGVDQHRGERNRESKRLFELLIRHRYREAKDPKDKVLGLQGLMNKRMRTHLLVDYDMSTAEIYTRVALECLREDAASKSEHQGLVSLLGSRGEPTIPDLPTWATDWSPHDTGRGWHNWYSSKHLYPHSSCDRAEGPNRRITIREENRALILEGVLVDTIAAASTPATSVGANHVLAEKLKEWRNFARREHPKVTSSDDDPRLKDPASWDSCTYPHGGGTNASAFWLAVTAKMIFGNGLIDLNHPMNSRDEEELRKFVDSGGRQGEVFQRETAKRWVNHMNFFVTKGGYIGTAAWTLGVGDELWILYGSNYPFVLRRREGGEKREGEWGEYTKIGDAYVPGIMHGEYFRDKGGKARTDRETKTIRLY